MRINGRNSSREVTPDKNIGSPTPVIVSVGNRPMESVIKTAEQQYGNQNRPIRSPMFYRSTVISPNPERLLYSTIEHPSVILNASRFNLNHMLQEQPMDFSPSSRDHFDRTYQNNDRPEYSVKLAIAV